jgi:hypothetical protein
MVVFRDVQAVFSMPSVNFYKKGITFSQKKFVVMAFLTRRLTL